MANWSDIITLVGVSSPEDDTDMEGFYRPPTETRRDIYANKRSVGINEFYKAAHAGYSAELKFIVRSCEYYGENYVEYAGKRYKVLRTYDTTSVGSARHQRTYSGEFIELTLTDLSERKAPYIGQLSFTADAGEGGADD